MDAHERFSPDAFWQWKFGAAFLMPFFFFVSGLSWRADTSLRTALRQAIGLILIAWSATVLAEFVRLGMTIANVVHLFGDTPSDVWQFFKRIGRALLLGDRYALVTMWFFTAIGLVRLIAAAGLRLGWSVTLAVTAALTIVGLAIVSTRAINFYQTAVLGAGLAFFLFGYAARSTLRALEARPWIALAALLVTGALLAATFGLNQGCAFDYATRCSRAWLGGEFAVAMSFGIYGFLPLFAFTGAVGVLFAALFALMLARLAGPLARKLAVLGRSTVPLLIVNGAWLAWAEPLIVRDIAPRVPAHGVVFFLALFVLTLTANLLIAALLRRPLRAWISAAMRTGGAIADAAKRQPMLSALAPRRVSVLRDRSA